MPGGDRTGPCGRNSFAGRGKGQCRNSISMVEKLPRKRIGQSALLIPFISALIRDMINPNGLIRVVAKKLLRLHKTDRNRNVIEAEYVVLSDNKSNTNDAKKIPLKNQKNNDMSV